MANPRIITGAAKGKRLEVPAKGTRPMTDMIKSALFSMIFDLIPDALVLDLYAGTGALGLECLSRGAEFTVFVDRSKYAVTTLHHNVNNTGFESKSKILKSSSKRFLEEYAKFELKHKKYDIIFFAPPHKDYKEKILALTAPYMAKGGVVIAEHSTETPASDLVGELEKIDERIYGGTTLSFYRHV